MNRIIEKILLTRDKIMPKFHLKQPVFTDSACGPFTKHREIIQKLRETSNLTHLYRQSLFRS